MESSRQGITLTAADRLRLYRRCFHDLDQLLTQLQEDATGIEDTELQMVQAELQCLEDLIMLFTDIGSVVPTKIIGGDVSEALLSGVDGLNLSLVTDILMLSATSPWIVYVAERSQWQLSYVSPSVKRVLGWRPAELLGVPAWDGCHPEDIVILQRMLLLKENGGNSLVYRRVKKDRTYATVQATGRVVGTRWYAWVEQDATNFSSNLPNGRCNDGNSDLPLSLPPSKSGSKGESRDGSSRSRKMSTSRPTLESDMHSRAWNSALAPRPASPLAALSGLERQGRSLKPRASITESDKAAQFDSEEKCATSSVEIHSLDADETSKVGVLTESISISGLDSNSKKGKGISDDVASIPSKPKAPNLPSKIRASTAANEELDLLWGKKVLIVEDDRVNRTIAQKLLENIKCNVTVACNGKEALEILQKELPLVNGAVEMTETEPQFDLVLMDLLMPVMDGTKAVQYFRDWEAEQEPARKKMVIFALTSNVSDGDMVKCAQSGFDEFVSKPLTIDKLLDRLR